MRLSSSAMTSTCSIGDPAVSRTTPRIVYTGFCEISRTARSGGIYPRAAFYPPVRREILGVALSQLFEGPSDVHARHLFPPWEVKIGVIHRLGGTVGGFSGGGNRLVGQR